MNRRPFDVPDGRSSYAAETVDGIPSCWPVCLSRNFRTHWFRTWRRVSGAIAAVVVVPLLVVAAGADETQFFDFDFPVGQSPRAILNADLNNDGNLDLVTANSRDDNVVVVLGIGDGTFTNPRVYDAGDFPASIVADDFNRDGNIDIATGNQFSDNIAVLLGRGDGTLEAPQFFATGRRPTVTTADFNGDGIADLATANAASYSVSILQGNGDGTFTLLPSFGYPSTPRAIVPLDFNTDGHTDLIVLVDGQIPNGGDLVLFIRGEGDGSFNLNGTLSTGIVSNSIRIGDLNQDDIEDIVITHPSDSSVSLLLRSENGFVAEVQELAVSSAVAATIADFNADGASDLATIGGDTVSILLAEKDGSLGSPQDFVFDPFLNSATSADFDGDGLADVAVTNQTANTVTVLLNQSDTIILGDINLDCQTNLLDVDPFVAVLVAGEFQAEADINQDGAVNALDIPPFVDLILGE